MAEELKGVKTKLNFKHNARYFVIDLGEPTGEEKSITLHCGHKLAYTTDSLDSNKK